MKWLFLLLTLSAMADSVIPEHRTHLAIDNRPLARIHGRTISLMDVIKKMDVFINENSPEVFSSEAALYQFYATNWRATLDELITTEMILTDAADKEIKVSDGDVREELESRFGPNIAATLDKLNLTYDEALEMVEREILVARMKWYKVHSKALQEVTPKIIKEAYITYLEANPPTTEWVYRLLSLRGNESGLLAEKAKKLDGLTLEEMKETLEKENLDATITLTNDYTVTEKSIASLHRSILERIGIETVSQPLEQTSKTGEKVWRIYHLKSKNVKEPISFDSACERIKEQLISEKISKADKEYVAYLKGKFNLTDDILTGHIDESYQPFALK